MSLSPAPGATPGRTLAAIALALGAASAAAQTAKPADAWTLTVRAEGAYESNPLYTAAEVQDDFVTRWGAGVSRRLGSKRGHLEVDFEGGMLAYRTYGELDRFTWGAGLRGTRRLSRRVSLGVDARGSQGYARDNPLATEAGVIPPYALTRTDAGNASLTYQLSRGWQGRLRVHGERFDFGSAALQNGWTAVARAGMQHGSSRSSTTGAYAELERTSTAGLEYGIQRLAATWGGTLTRGLTAELEAGAAIYRVVGGTSGDPATDAARVTPTAGVGVDVRVRRHSLGARLERRVGQTYGLGTVGISRVASLEYGLELRARFGVAARAELTRVLSAAAVAEPLTRADNFNAGVRYGLTRLVTVRLDYSFWRRGEAGVEPRGHTVALSAGRRFSWR